MKKLYFFAALLLGLASCQNEDCYGNQYAKPETDYASQYVGNYHLQLNVSNVFGFSGVGPAYVAPLNVDFSITKDPSQCNMLWISGLYGTRKLVSASASESGLNISAAATGMYPSEVGFNNIDGDFDELSIQGNLSPSKSLSYYLSDQDINMLYCYGTAVQ